MPMTHALATSSDAQMFTPALLSRHEAAKVAGISLSTLDRHTKAGKIPCKRIGGRVLYPRGPFMAWCESPTQIPAPGVFNQMPQLPQVPTSTWKLMGIAA
jgi:excisionase family DNA binding protein